jgi:TatD DNase family protein
MFDSHCHVTDIDSPQHVLTESKRQGVTSLLCCGYNRESNAAVLRLRDAVSTLPIALGLHPWFATELPRPDCVVEYAGASGIDDVLRLIGRELPVAIGECGLDAYDRDPEIPPLSAQFPVFEAQLDLAQRMGLPVTVHSRKAVHELIAVVGNFPRVRGVLHAYSGSAEQVRPLLERGWMVGIGGGTTRPGASRLRRLATRVEMSQILLETDAPAIGLQGVSPPHVRPYHVVEVARVLASLRGVDFDQVVAQTDENALKMFGPQGVAAFT